MLPGSHDRALRDARANDLHQPKRLAAAASAAATAAIAAARGRYLLVPQWPSLRRQSILYPFQLHASRRQRLWQSRARPLVLLEPHHGALCDARASDVPQPQCLSSSAAFAAARGQSDVVHDRHDLL